MSFGSTSGEQLYWDIVRSSIAPNSNRVCVGLGNGLEYRLALSYVLPRMEAKPYSKGNPEVETLKQPWAVRSFCYGKGPGEQGHYDYLRVFDKRSHCSYLFSSETVLMMGEPAYEDFAGDRYPEYCPGHREYIVDALRAGPKSVEIVVSPRRLKNARFFHVREVEWYRRPGIILFFTAGGDQYGALARQYPDAQQMLTEIGTEQFETFKGVHHRGIRLMPERLDEQAQKRLDDFVENLAFDLDYRFRGRRREYGCNAVWHIVPADRITENGYVWPSKYTWEYS